ncbi:MAG: MXAN_5187 C-terminal domain-containing protein [Polyangiaceae bacterium]
MPQPTEIETLVSELELAVDRVRSLYEQYFMGIEKLEPTVPRKDVDRRIHILRKEQIRNTAQRFRFQMIIQRYNTYQTHWQRICREIEGGTYKRHVIRAQQRFGEGTAAQRRRDSRRPPPADVASLAFEAELAELDREFAPAGDMVPMLELDMELLQELPDSGSPAPRAPASSPRLPTSAPRAPASAPRLPVSAAPPPRPGPPGPLPRAPSLAPPAKLAPPLRPGAAPSLPPARPPAPAPPPRPPPAPVAQAPAVAKPPPAPAKPPAPAPKPSPSAPRPPHDLPDERVRAIYAQYVDAKRRQNESTAAITYDAVAKSLRDSSAKLREKHGKPVDFEVAIKDGKAILKPVIK